MIGSWRAKESDNPSKFIKFPSAPCTRWCSVQMNADRCLSSNCDEHSLMNKEDLKLWLSETTDKAKLYSKTIKLICN
jgi:hypothetical protein